MRSLNASFHFYGNLLLLPLITALNVWVILRPFPVPSWVLWTLFVGPVLVVILTVRRGIQRITLDRGELSSFSKGKCNWQIPAADIVRGSGKLVNLNRIEFCTQDGRSYGFETSRNYSEGLDVINHLLERTEESINSDDDTIRLLEGRLRFALGEDSFELAEGVVYRVNQAYSPRRDLELQWLVLIVVSVVSLFLTSIAITAIKQIPVAIALCVGWFVLLASLVGNMAIKTFSRSESVHDQFVVRDGQLIITRDYLPFASIPVPEWDPPQSPVKAVQELDVLGKRYLLDRSVLVPELKP